MTECLWARRPTERKIKVLFLVILQLFIILVKVIVYTAKMIYIIELNKEFKFIWRDLMLEYVIHVIKYSWCEHVYF